MGCYFLPQKTTEKYAPTLSFHGLMMVCPQGQTKSLKNASESPPQPSQSQMTNGKIILKAFLTNARTTFEKNKEDLNENTHQMGSLQLVAQENAGWKQNAGTEGTGRNA